MKTSKNEMKTGQNLNVFRLLRIARDKKVKDIAEELEVTTAYINAIENGDRYPSARLLKDYAKALGVKAETISCFQKKNETNKKFENFMLEILKTICELDETKKNQL